MTLAATTAASNRASDFVATLGINTHIDFANYGYQDLATVESSINYLGVKNIRDSAGSPYDAQPWLQVAQATNAKFDDYIGETSPGGMATELIYAYELASAGILNYLEGGNEEDDDFPASLGNTLQIAAQFQQQVYQTGQALGLPVINMSFGAGWTPYNDYQGNYGAVGDLGWQSDYGNAHTYPTPGQGTDWAIQRLNGLARLADAADPVAITEVGWNEDQGFGQANIAKYVLQAALDGTMDGNPLTYFYGLFDDSSGPFGLMNQDGSPKPAGAALHNLTSLLRDSGPAAGVFTPGVLDYWLTGTTASDNSLLMEKSDGTFWLSLWNEADDPHDVTLTLGTPATEIKVFDPLSGIWAIQDISDAASATISVSDSPLIVEVVASNSAAATDTSAGTPPPATIAAPSDLSPAIPAPVSASETAPSPVPESGAAVAIAESDASPVVLDSNLTISANAGDHMLFIGGTQDVATLTGGTEQVQAYQGYNRIVTGQGDDTISIAGTGSTVDAGSGTNTVYDSGGGNVIAMPTAEAGFDDIFGYVVQDGDTFDFASALQATTWDGTADSVDQFVQIATSGNDAVISISATANGASTPVATLHDSGTVSMATLMAQSRV